MSASLGKHGLPSSAAALVGEGEVGGGGTDVGDGGGGGDEEDGGGGTDVGDGGGGDGDGGGGDGGGGRPDDAAALVL